MPYTVVFFTSNEIALPLLKSLHSDSRFKVLALIDQKLSQAEELYETFKTNPPDFLLVFAYGQFLPVKWLKLPRLAPLNVHPSLLPRYRGASPIQSVLLHGDQETGISIIKMIPEMDAGPVAAQLRCSVSADANFITLSKDLSEKAATFVPDVLAQVAKRGDAIFTEQNDDEATYTKKLEREDGRVDFLEPAQKIFRKFCAYMPWPGVFTMYKGKRLKFIQLEPCTETLNPGEIRCEKTSFLIGTVQGALRIKEVQLEGKKILSAEAFLRGQRDFCSSVLTS